MKLFFAGNLTWAGIESILPARLYSYHTLITPAMGGGGASVFKKTWLSGPYFKQFYFDQMTLFFAGGENGSWQEIIDQSGGENVLLSYQYLTGKVKPDSILGMTDPRWLFIDSGAFSAWASGEVIDIRKYIDFLHQYSWAYDICAGLDVIGDWKATLKNQVILETAGLTPLWTFHVGEPWGLLKEQIQHRDYIALGGMVPYSVEELTPWLARCFSIIRDSTRVHGFGMTTPRLMLKFPFYSIDSTTYLGGSKRASVYFWDSVKMSISEQCVNKKKKSDHRTIGFNDQILGRKGWRDRVAHNVKTFIEMQDFVTRSWKRKGVNWDAWDKLKGMPREFNQKRKHGNKEN